MRVEVVLRHHYRDTSTHTGRRDGDAVAFEFENGQRLYLLVDKGVVLQQPDPWRGTFRDGWWYVDICEVTDHGDRVEAMDMWADVVVREDPARYWLLDLDELGDAITAGELDPTTAADVLRRTDAFLRTHLHSGASPDRTRHADRFIDFPPGAIEGLRAPPPPGGRSEGPQ